MVERSPSSELDSLGNLEEEFTKNFELSGYEAGFEQGKKAGQEEGYPQGLLEGAKVGREVGYYRGFSMTWIQLLRSDEALIHRSTKVLKTLHEIVDLVDAFPKTNETSCEEKLSDIRVKFKQSASLLNLKL